MADFTEKVEMIVPCRFSLEKPNKIGFTCVIYYYAFYKFELI